MWTRGRCSRGSRRWLRQPGKQLLTQQGSGTQINTDVTDLSSNTIRVTKGRVCHAFQPAEKQGLSNRNWYNYPRSMGNLSNLCPILALGHHNLSSYN
jgi:hypothetical protein